ncbi:probable methyltransferase-like protein 24 [Ylistrum balloti]|uniref:probable methyltransferase-like protein 24 n=1 Tax=Ylistrum balloti TaxID=509963 RepID=UPI002905AE59|nr:probable methyltransferase-like protein 24 [Ylistrum balloti]
MMQRNKPSVLVVSIVIIVLLVLIITTKRNKQRIFSRPVWDFNIEKKCRNELRESGDKDDVINGHQLPSKKDLCSLSMHQIESTYAWYFNNIQTICGHMKRFGKVNDGGWDVCVEDSMVRRDSCLVYSFGIDFDFSFDDDISEQWGCVVHSFDPSMDTSSHQRSPKVSFHNLGLSNVNAIMPKTEWTMMTFNKVRETLGHQTVFPDIIKMDIEDWEWHVIPEMLSSKVLNNVKQFLVEFHFSNIPEADSRLFWISKFFLLKDLYAIGFRMTWVNRNLLNVWKSRVTGENIIGCFEITFIRKL